MEAVSSGFRERLQMAYRDNVVRLCTSTRKLRKQGRVRDDSEMGTEEMVSITHDDRVLDKRENHS